ncbi:hypothetical protein ACFQL4_20435 [Halosimplex aquaticum]
MFLGLLAALLLNEVRKGVGDWLQAVVFSPYFAAPLASGVIWMFFLGQNYGFVARLFRQFGLQPIAFLAEGSGRSSR